MVGHGGSSAGSYLADPTSPIPSHYASIVVTSTVTVKSQREITLLITFLLIPSSHVVSLAFQSVIPWRQQTFV